MRSFLVLSSLVVSLGLGGCGGCGDGNSVGHLPDAPRPPDGPEPDAPADAVTLTVINHGVPATAVHVYFLNADGSVAKTAITDGTGSATAVVTEGGSVTAIRPFDPPPPAGKFAPDELRTFLGVKPGDHLVLSRAATDSVTAVFDGAAAPGGDTTTTYEVFTTCGGGPTSIVPGGSGSGSQAPNDPGGTRTLQDCHGAADIAVVASPPVVQAIANPGGNAVVTPQGLYHANASLPVNGANVPVGLRGDTYAALTDVPFTYMNAPDAVINVAHFPILPNGNLGPYQATAAGGTATTHEVTVSATTAIVDSSLSLTNQHEIVDWGPFVTTYTLDMANLLLREVTAAPTYDRATRRLSWTEADDGATPDLTVAAILVRRPDPLAKWHWEVVAPYSRGGIVFPHLPADLADWTAVETDTVNIDPVKNVKVTGGYDAVRAHILDIHDELGATGYVIGDRGTAVIVQSTLP